MNTITTTQLQEALFHVCDIIIDAEGMLTELDTIIGDGDHGIGMKTGFSALRTLLQGERFTDTFTLLKESGLMLIKVMGGTSGVIFGTMFIGGLSAVKDKDPITVQDFAEYIDLGTKAISVRGKVDRGAKTMYDALAEARDSLLKAAEEKKIFSMEAMWLCMHFSSQVPKAQSAEQKQPNPCSPAWDAPRTSGTAQSDILTPAQFRPA